MPTENELVRTAAETRPDAGVFLGRTRLGERENEHGREDNGDFDFHVWCVGDNVQFYPELSATDGSPPSSTADWKSAAATAWLALSIAPDAPPMVMSQEDSP